MEIANMIDQTTAKKPADTIEEALQILNKIASNPSHITDLNDGIKHRWSEREARALQVALLTRRPLLLRGEPGSGKTQLSKAFNAELGWELLHETVYPKMEPQDLMYRFDAIQRLSDAHTKAGLCEEIKYYEAGILWQALDWKSAIKSGKKAKTKTKTETNDNAESTTPVGFVICIDEIDKADSDFPNSLLEVFGERKLKLPCEPFELNWPKEDGLAPVVIITTNEDRTLPAPFLRRCVVLDMDYENLTAEWLVENRALAYYEPTKTEAVAKAKNYLSLAVMQEAANNLIKDRESLKNEQLYYPGVAEYLDLLKALHQLQQNQNLSDVKLLEQVEILGQFLYRKNSSAESSEATKQNTQPKNNES